MAHHQSVLLAAVCILLGISLCRAQKTPKQSAIFASPATEFYMVGSGVSSPPADMLSICTTQCRAADTDGYPAWILSAYDQSKIQAVLTIIGTLAALGGKRVGSTWRWTSAPMRMSDPDGLDFYIQDGSATRYSNFNTGEPSNHGGVETDLGIWNTGKWFDYASSGSVYQYCACRVFKLAFPFFFVGADTSTVSDVQDVCNSNCSMYEPTATTAWILSQAENDVLSRVLNVSWLYSAFVEGMRFGAVAPYEWRWISPPVLEKHPNGLLFATQQPDTMIIFTNWHPGEPSSTYPVNGSMQVRVYGALPYGPAGLGTWDDFPPQYNYAVEWSYCACRIQATRSESVSATESSTEASVTPSMPTNARSVSMTVSGVGSGSPSSTCSASSRTTSGTSRPTATLTVTAVSPSTTNWTINAMSNTESIHSVSETLDATMSFTIPVPNAVHSDTTVQLVRDGIEAVTPVFQYSLGAVSTSGLSITRMGAVSKISKCGAAEYNEPQSLFSFKIIGCGDSSNRLLAEYARGDAVLTIAVVLGASGFLVLCTWAWGVKRKITNAAAELSVPSVLLPLWGAALPTGVNGIVQLGVGSTGCVQDVLLLLVAIVVVVVVPFVVLVLGTLRMIERLNLVRRSPHKAINVIGYLMKSNWRWEPLKTEPSQPLTFIHCHGRLLAVQYRVLWYAVLEVTVLVALGVIGALAVDLPMAACVGLGSTSLALLCLQWLICAATRPFASLFDNTVGVVTLTLKVAGCVVQVVLLHDPTSTSAQIAAATCDLLLLGVSGVKGVVDLHTLFGGLYRRWSWLVHPLPAIQVHLESDIVLDDVDDLLTTPQAEGLNHEVDDVLLDMDQLDCTLVPGDMSSDDSQAEGGGTALEQAYAASLLQPMNEGHMDTEW